MYKADDEYCVGRNYTLSKGGITIPCLQLYLEADFSRCAEIIEFDQISSIVAVDIDNFPGAHDAMDNPVARLEGEPGS